MNTIAAKGAKKKKTEENYKNYNLRFDQSSGKDVTHRKKKKFSEKLVLQN